MTQTNRALIRDFIAKSLAGQNDEEPFDDDDSLFLSGRLDSLTVTRLVVFLEDHFAIDFGQHEFDVAGLDSVDLIVAFAERHGAAAAE